MIAVVGFMGAGKTSVGRVVARKLRLPFIDTDRAVEEAAGTTIAALFSSAGESEFRALERRVVQGALETDGVVALGGGAHLDPGTAAAFEGADVVYLRASLPEVMTRIGSDAGRPLLAQRDPATLFEERAGSYERVATVTVDTEGLSIEEVADEVIAQLGHPPAQGDGVGRIPVALGERSYEVLVGRGLLARLDELEVVPPSGRAFVITHPALERYAAVVEESLGRRGLRPVRMSVAEGEGSKSLTAAGALYDELAAVPAHRGDVVVAVGGGVVGDLAGFVASTYARGLPLLQVPTSLLAQVDAAIGGKTAVNLAAGKNLIGTFHQPVAVVADIDTLATLPEEEFVSGMAEVIKYGLIAEPNLLGYVTDNSDTLKRRDPVVLQDIVARCAAIKAGIVASDETEQGRRAHLNYGHTFAHAIEHLHGYGALRHGEAVALGMMAAASLARELGYLDDGDVRLHRRILQALGLPVSAPLEVDDLAAAWQRDKKYRDGVRFVLLQRIGFPVAGIEADRDTIRVALERMTS